MDLRYAFRTLLKNPGFTAVAVLTLALGIGGTTAIFSVVNAVLLRPLPYKDPGRLMVLWDIRPGRPRVSVTPGDFEAWQHQTRTFDGMAGLDYEVTNLIGGHEPQLLPTGFVSPNFFDLLGVHAALGRLLQPSDGTPGQTPVVVLSHAIWQQQFGGDPSVVGRTVTLNDKPCTVVGVLPKGFTFWNFDDVQLWSPLPIPRTMDHLHGWRYLNVVGRLKPGATRTTAQSDLTVIMRQLAGAYPDYNSGTGANVIPLRTEYVGGIRTALLVLLGAVGFVLLIGCANVANLLLARATGRRRELAVRSALGASRVRLVRQLLAESLVVAAAGGVAGLLLALWGQDALVRLAHDVLPRVAVVRLDMSVLAFTFGLSLLTGLVFGVGPALQVSRPDLTDALKDGGRGTVGAGHHRLRSTLVAAEVGLAVVLLIGAGLLLRSFARLLDVNPGFNPRHLLAARMTLPESRYATGARQQALFDAVVERARALSGVLAAGAVSDLPLSGNNDGYGFTIEGRPASLPADRTHVSGLIVTPGCFRTMDIPLLRGRLFTALDGPDTQKVAIINAAMARQYWPDRNPIGQHVRLGSKAPWLTIVGVVGNVRFRSLDDPAGIALYRPLEQAPTAGMTIVLRTAGDPVAAAGALRAEVAAIDRDQPIGHVTTMERLISESAAPRRLNAELLGGFAGLALLLAAIGVYGVMAYAVAQRTHEIGVRIALGAASRDIVRTIVGSGMRLVGLGLAAGLVAAVLLTRLLSSLLFEVSPLDPLTFTGIPLLLAAVALLASYLPARRAMRVDPVVALREE